MQKNLIVAIAKLATVLNDFEVTMFSLDKSLDGTVIEIQKATGGLSQVVKPGQNVFAGGQTFAGTTEISRGSRNAM